MVAGFPGWTHLIAVLAFPVWSIGTDAYMYGIDTRYDWWQGFGTLMTVLVLSVLLIALPPAVALEAWAVIRMRNRWVARGAVICYALIAGFISFVPTGLRFGGDNSPTAMDLVTLSLASYGIVIGAQVLCPTSRADSALYGEPHPSVARHDPCSDRSHVSAIESALVDARGQRRA